MTPEDLQSLLAGRRPIEGGHLKLLALLAAEGGLTGIEAAQRLRVSTAWISRAAHLLHTHGYIAMSARRKDRRQKVLSPTKAGRELAAQIVATQGS